MIDAILGAIMTLLYNMFAGIIFGLMDGIQAMFKTFAGTGVAGFDGNKITAGNSGQENDTGLIYYLFNTPLIKNVFLSILLLGIFLLIIFTVMAFIKNAYASKQKKWQEIIGNSIKGLANFVFLPVCCLLGVWLSNILLNAIDGATNLSGSTTMSRMVYVSCAYNANAFRNSECDQYHYTIEEMDAAVQALVQQAGVQDQFKIKKYSKGDIEGARIYYADYVDKIYGASEVLSVYHKSDIEGWYRVQDINFLVMIVGGIFVIYTLVTLTFGMVKRMFILLILYVISPGLCAMYPLDDGGAVKKWKDDFVKNTISAYGAVAGLNLFFSISPLIQKIEIGGGWMSQFMNTTGLTSLVLTIAGLYVVKDLIGMISNYIGAGNALSDGASLAGNVKKRMGQGAKFIGNRAKGVAGAFQRAKGAREAGGSFAGSLFRSAAGAGNDALKKLTGIDIKGTRDDLKKAKKDGAKGYEDHIADIKEAEKDDALKRYLGFRGDKKGKLDQIAKDGFKKEDIADFLDTIGNPEEKKAVARIIAGRQNAIAASKQGKEAGIKYTDADKILGTRDKLEQEKQRVTNVQSSNKSQTASHTAYATAATGYDEARDQAKALGIDDSAFNADGSMNIKKHSAGSLERLKNTNKAAYQQALNYNEAIDRVNAAQKERRAAEKEYRSSVLRLADNIIQLAENYNGEDKTNILQCADDIKKYVSNESKTADDIKNHIENRIMPTVVIPSKNGKPAKTLENVINS